MDEVQLQASHDQLTQISHTNINNSDSGLIKSPIKTVEQQVHIAVCLDQDMPLNTSNSMDNDRGKLPTETVAMDMHPSLSNEMMQLPQDLGHSGVGYVKYSTNEPAEAADLPNVDAYSAGELLYEKDMLPAACAMSNDLSDMSPIRVTGSNSDGLTKKSYVCDVCDKVCNRSDNLKSHMRAVHTNERPYMCTVCQKTFSRQQHMTTHMRSHTGEKPFHCQTCDKYFSESKSLKNHIKIHTGERPAICDICGKGFTHSGHLKRHLMTHTTEKPFTCGLCDKGFTRSQNLEKHMASHTTAEIFQCHVCQKKFPSPEILNIHMQWHAGEKVPICEYCSKVFTRQDYLRKHIKVAHLGRKDYECGLCGRMFSEIRSLRNHMFTKHEKDREMSEVKVDTGPPVMD